MFCFQIYSLITNCKHSDCDWNCDWDVNCDDCYRNGLSNCIREDVESVDDCQEACSNFNSCVGFDYRIWSDSTTSCLLYPSSSSGSQLLWSDCPSGYYLAEHFYTGEGFATQEHLLTTATTSNDLVAQSETGHSCYAKISGKITKYYRTTFIHLFFQFFVKFWTYNKSFIFI